MVQIVFLKDYINLRVLICNVWVIRAVFCFGIDENFGL